MVVNVIDECTEERIVGFTVGSNWIFVNVSGPATAW